MTSSKWYQNISPTNLFKKLRTLNLFNKIFVNQLFKHKSQNSMSLEKQIINDWMSLYNIIRVRNR